MNIMNTLTRKHMKKNKKRTIVTILGIMISVAMFTAVTTFATSFMQMLQINYNNTNGDWHVRYRNLNKEDISFLKDQDNNVKVVPKYYLNTMELMQDEEEDPILFDINTLDQQGFRDFVTLREGSYPTNDSEIILHYNHLRWNQVDISIGDTISLTLEDETSVYTIVGLFDNSFTAYDSQMFGVESFTYTTTQTIENSESLYAYVSLASVSNAIYQNSEELANEMGITIDDIFYNSNLVYYGVSTNSNFLTSLYTIGFIIMTIIMIGSIMLIYNAFAISLSERSKHLGMLSSIGATRSQKRRTVFYEGFLLGIFSIPLGILVGIGGMAGTFAIINPIIQDMGEIEGFPLVVSFMGIVIAVIFAIITIFLSTYIPAKRAGKISPMEAIRSSHDIKISKRSVKTSFITKLFFGFEGALALKNIKRNKKRYYVTVISLIVSVILFLSVSGFTYYFQEAFAMSQETLNFDAMVSTSDSTLASELLQVEHATSVARTQFRYVNGSIPITEVSDDVISFLRENDWGFDDEFYISLYIRTYDSEYLEQFYDSQNINTNQVIINKTNILPINRMFKEASILKDLPTSFTLTYDEYDMEDDATQSRTLTLDNIVYTNDLPLGAHQPYSPDTLEVIVPQEIFETISSDNDFFEEVYFTTDDNENLDKEITEIINKHDSIYVYYTNIPLEIRTINQLLFIVNVFAYGFITLISLISIANIFNTITTSVSLRTKEFAMLKSIGMQPKSFRKMIYFESIFYGLHTLLFSIPISIAIMYLMHRSLTSVFDNAFTIPLTNIIIAIISVFVIVGTTLLFSTTKIRKQNIIDGLRTENI